MVKAPSRKWVQAKPPKSEAAGTRVAGTHIWRQSLSDHGPCAFMVTNLLLRRYHSGPPTPTPHHRPGAHRLTAGLVISYFSIRELPFNNFRLKKIET